jgi:hypothetical protein
VKGKRSIFRKPHCRQIPLIKGHRHPAAGGRQSPIAFSPPQAAFQEHSTRFFPDLKIPLRKRHSKGNRPVFPRLHSFPPQMALANDLFFPRLPPLRGVKTGKGMGKDRNAKNKMDGRKATINYYDDDDEAEE